MATIEKKRKILNHQKATMSSDKTITDFIAGRNNKLLQKLKGKISFRDDYDYKLMR
ncbi:MAG: hypothetical protein LBE36_04845 [Flavobacteriaceae bacterium]|nr:hypothetical protein [Flavobacteriaceae bacterium]